MKVNLIKIVLITFGFTMIYVAHDQTEELTFADEVVVMYQGLVVEQGSKKDIFNPPHPEYTKLLLSSVPEMDPNWLNKVLEK